MTFGQILILTVVLVTVDRWWSARLSATPVKPKTPKPPRVCKRWERWGMGLGSLAITVVWLANLFNPRMSSLELTAISIILIPTVIFAACHALTPIPPITSRQWLVIGLSLFVFFISALVICPPVGLLTPLVTLAAIGIYHLCSDVQKTKPAAFIAVASPSRGPESSVGLITPRP